MAKDNNEDIALKPNEWAAMCGVLKEILATDITIKNHVDEIIKCNVEVDQLIKSTKLKELFEVMRFQAVLEERVKNEIKANEKKLLIY